MALKLSRIARADFREAADYYREIDPGLANRWVDAVEHRLVDIGRQPRLGSPRFSETLSVVGLRYKAVSRFPYLVFYVETENDVIVVRILHERRDVASEMEGASDERL
jgi:toxin ParE1/3/4